MSVDDLIQNLYDRLNELNILGNTYWFYMSDHGFHLGQFGMTFDKRQLYETDIRIPFFAAGPNIQPGSVSNVIADNIDIAPTLLSKNKKEKQKNSYLFFSFSIFLYFWVGTQNHEISEPKICNYPQNLFFLIIVLN